MEHPRYAVLLWAVTAGTQADALGADETDTVALGWSVVDLVNTKVILSQTDAVKPRSVDINDNVQLSEEAREQCSVAEERLREARPLEQVIDEFISLLQTRLDCSDPADFQLVTDGQLHLRQVLHPEAIRHQINLPSSMFSFFDLRKEFSRFYNADTTPSSVAEMLNYLSLEPDGGAEYIPRQLQNMASIICRMLNDGHKFTEPEIIIQRLEPGICSKGETIDSACVARARGLPWQSSDQDIAKFFRGLNIGKGGVALCLTAMGRRNGEALIRFESAEHRDMALRRHRHHIGQRYIEVYRATGEDFINVAGGNNNEAQAFLSRGGQVIVRMRGLPYDCTAKQIIEFFGQADPPIQVLTDSDEGILFVKKPDGRATGDAFVLFASEEAAARALAKHRQVIGSRYIELFRSSTAEVQQVLNRTMDGRGGGGGAVSDGGAASAAAAAAAQMAAAAALGLQGGHPQMGSPTNGHHSPLLANIAAGQVSLMSQPLLQASRKDCIRLRGLPYEAQVEHILDFLGDLAKNIVFQGVHMIYNAQGQPSGEAFIQMNSEQSAYMCATQRHNRFLVINKKQRYIEVFQCSLDDVLLGLQGGIQQQQQPSSPVNALAAAAALSQQGGVPIGHTGLRWSATDPSAAAAAAAAAFGPASPFGSLAAAGLFYPAAAAAAAAAAAGPPTGAGGAPGANAYSMGGPGGASPRVSPTSPLAPLSPIGSLSPLALLPPSAAQFASHAASAGIPSGALPPSASSLAAATMAPILLSPGAAHYAQAAAALSAAAAYPPPPASAAHHHHQQQQAATAAALRLLPPHLSHHHHHQQNAYASLYTNTAQC